MSRKSGGKRGGKKCEPFAAASPLMSGAGQTGKTIRTSGWSVNAYPCGAGAYGMGVLPKHCPEHGATCPTATRDDA